MQLRHRMPCREGSESGATATEYLFLLVFVAIAIIGGATLYGQTLDTRFATGASTVSTATN